MKMEAEADPFEEGRGVAGAAGGYKTIDGYDHAVFWLLTTFGLGAAMQLTGLQVRARAHRPPAAAQLQPHVPRGHRERPGPRPDSHRIAAQLRISNSPVSGKMALWIDDSVLPTWCAVVRTRGGGRTIGRSTRSTINSGSSGTN
eukprot:SAG11_NODE_2090_length_3843_cov_4.605502_3_plen_144_part_00